MYIKDDKAFVSIGVNCLPEVQFLKRFGIWKGKGPDPKNAGYIYKRGPFDTGGVSPEALIEILNLIKEDKAIDELSDIKDYYEEVQSEGEIFYGHKFVHGFTLTHEEEDFSEFPQSIKNRFDNFKLLPKDTTLVWCNAQANFHPELKSSGTKIKDYYLTEKRYQDITSLINEMYGYPIKFVVRDIYTDKSLLNLSNVYTIDIPFGTFNLFGTKKQFDPIFEERQ
jgi:hypothetical protein